jgi:hypothetical protein
MDSSIVRKLHASLYTFLLKSPTNLHTETFNLLTPLRARSKVPESLIILRFSRSSLTVSS